MADLQQTVDTHKWSPVSCRSSAGQGQFAGQRLTFYHCATQPTYFQTAVLSILLMYNDNHLTARYEPAPELSETLTKYTDLIVPKLLTSTPNLPSRPPSLPLGSNTKKNLGKQLKHEEPEDKNPSFLYTRLILDLMRSLVNRWSRLTHTSCCMTTSRSAATTQTRARVSPAMHSTALLHQMTFLPQPYLSPSLRTGSKNAGMHTLKLGYQCQMLKQQLTYRIIKTKLNRLKYSFCRSVLSSSL